MKDYFDKNGFVPLLFLIVVTASLAFIFLVGCHGVTVHIDGTAKPRDPKVEPKPAPPQPPPDDWAPPWFHRPKPAPTRSTLWVPPSEKPEGFEDQTGPLGTTFK